MLELEITRVIKRDALNFKLMGFIQIKIYFFSSSLTNSYLSTCACSARGHKILSRVSVALVNRIYLLDVFSVSK